MLNLFILYKFKRYFSHLYSEKDDYAVEDKLATDDDDDALQPFQDLDAEIIP